MDRYYQALPKEAWAEIGNYKDTEIILEELNKLRRSTTGE